jgi:hypothetical protein
MWHALLINGEQRHIKGGMNISVLRYLQAILQEEFRYKDLKRDNPADGSD